jgi:hypothetical protein
VHLDIVITLSVTVPHRQKANIDPAMKNRLKAAALPTLADLEREVVAEYRELGRQQLERRLQTLAAQTGEVFPPEPTPTPTVNPAH